MDIKAEKFVIEMSHDDLWNTAFDVKNAIKYSLLTHWVNYQKEWQQHEKPRLARLEYMFKKLGVVELYEQIFDEAKEIFAKHNEQTQK